MSLSRVTSGVQFNTGISTTDWSSGAVGQTTGQTQSPLLPGSTTVSEALGEIFATDTSVEAQLMAELAAAGNSPFLRTSNGFHAAARRTIRALRGRSGEKAAAAAAELEELLDDTELLNQYRAALLES